MKKRTSGKAWFPFWIDKWIFGSMRIEFNVEERGVWIDLYALATKDNGYIRANEDIPYPMEQLSGMLVIPKEKLEKAIESFVEKGKMQRFKNGTLIITKWEKYQFSERWTREIEKSRASSGKEEACSGKKEPILYNRIEYNKNDNSITPSSRNILSPPHDISKTGIIFNFKSGKFKGILKKDISAWEDAYPACDVILEIKKAAQYMIANPKKKKKNWRRYLTNWLNRTQERGGTRSYVGKKAGEEWAKRKSMERKQDDDSI